MPQDEKRLPDGAYLRVRNWDKLYEINRTRELKKLDWVPVPNKQDGDGYSLLVDHPDAAAHYGCWVAILLIASKCEPRGTLIRDNGEPHTPHSLARISRLGAGIPQAGAGLMAETIERLVSEIGWLEVVENNHDRTIPQAGAGIPQDAATFPQEGAASRARAIGKGREGKGGEGKEALAPLATPTQPERNGPDLSDAFDELWNLYPKKGRTREVACRHFFVEILGHLEGDMLTRTIRAIRAPIEPGGVWAESAKWQKGYIQNLETYLAQRQWREEPESASEAVQPGMSDREAAIKRQEEIEDGWREYLSVPKK